MPRLLISVLFVGLLLNSSEVLAHDIHDAREPPHFKYSEHANIHLKPPVTFLPPKQKLRTESKEQVWLETSSAVLLISLAPFLVLCILPDLNKHQRLLKVLLAFAAGGLLGDAFLHLIPHAVNQASTKDDVHSGKHDHQHHLLVGVSIVSGIFMFLCIEKLMRLFQRGSGHSHATPASSNAEATVSDSKTKKSNKNKANKAAGDVASQKLEKKPSKSIKEFRVAGYLNLAADFTHNFTDGLAIGASFLISRNLGFVTTMTVLLHELPHEIGDYAILIQSGCSARKAMFLQLTTAIGAALGASLSLLAAGLGPSSFNLPTTHLTDDVINCCILPFTAGGFIYIAMTSVLPDLLTHVGSRSDSLCLRLGQHLAEMLSLIIGVGLMAALGFMEEVQ